jgi:hypothetical protein
VARTFDFGDLAGEAGPALDSEESLEPLVRYAVEAAHATRTLHWGRNYLYATRLATVGGELAVVVKQFRHDTLKARLRRWHKGSNARRSFRAALAVRAAGVDTPEPLFFCEGVGRRSPAHYVSAESAADFELRYYLRARNAGTDAADFPRADAAALWQALAEQVARLHRAAIWHRDWTSGNVLVTVPANRDNRDGDAVRLTLLDLNRARLGVALTMNERLRELSRMPIHRSADQAALLDEYFARALGRLPSAAERRRYRLYHDAFVGKHRIKNRLRGTHAPEVRGGGLLVKRVPHPHLPAADEGAAPRDRVVWDALSDQPHQHAGRAEKLAARLRDLPAQAWDFARAAVLWPGVLRRGRELAAEPRVGFLWPGLSIGLRPWPGREAELLEHLEASGVRRASIRLHPWQDDHAPEEALVASLRERGFDLAFTLPQNRALVKDPARWDGAVDDLAQRFGRPGETFQVGQAINRSKWGVWSIGEYTRLAESAVDALHRRGLRAAGPAVIDFEFHWTMAVLNAGRAAGGLAFDDLSALLYVDRRGAPENPQMGHDTPGKARLLRAIADRSARLRPGSRVWLSEVNWPLREGPHSPAGKAVSVDEETQADYLARYAVLAHATGVVDRIDWWQLVAIGYGLVDPRGNGAARRRAAFAVLAELERELRGRRFAGRLPSDAEVHAYGWRGDGGDLRVVGWTTGAPREWHGRRLGSRPAFWTAS